MSNAFYFLQECPTCGRGLQIRVEYLGKKVICRHCQGQLIAADPSNKHYSNEQSDSELIQRADELLDSMVRQSRISRRCPR